MGSPWLTSTGQASQQASPRSLPSCCSDSSLPGAAISGGAVNVSSGPVTPNFFMPCPPLPDMSALPSAVNPAIISAPHPIPPSLKKHQGLLPTPSSATRLLPLPPPAVSQAALPPMTVSHQSLSATQSQPPIFPSPMRRSRRSHMSIVPPRPQSPSSIDIRQPPVSLDHGIRQTGISSLHG